ncbi:ALOX5 [Mytilus coruscus]|uniref:ALOX5 n=1 Tax=Mytilus coruscus TaxID=42192 RepID=A0A6J8ARW1_MYTCO|nr:ALOX5 [Mytilus coruscus]
MELSKSYNYKVQVKTGDKKGAGTDANVRIIFHGKDGYKSEPKTLDEFFRNDFEAGNIDSFIVSLEQNFDKIDAIELWQDGTGLFAAWYVDWVEVTIEETGDIFIFPVFRWIKENYHYRIRHLDTCLPKNDSYHKQREMELEEKREMYKLVVKVQGAPIQVEKNKLNIDYLFIFVISELP